VQIPEALGLNARSTHVRGDLLTLWSSFPWGGTSVAGVAGAEDDDEYDPGDQQRDEAELEVDGVETKEI